MEPSSSSPLSPSSALIGREAEMITIQQSLRHFVEQFEDEKIIEKYEREKKATKKSNGTGMQRSVSLTGNFLTFKSSDVPRIIIEGDGGVGKSTLLLYLRDLASHENLTTW